MTVTLLECDRPLEDLPLQKPPLPILKGVKLPKCLAPIPVALRGPAKSLGVLLSHETAAPVAGFREQQEGLAVCGPLRTAAGRVPALAKRVVDRPDQDRSFLQQDFQEFLPASPEIFERGSSLFG